MSRARIGARRTWRDFLVLGGSPLSRKIIILNLVALNILLAGILHLDSTRDALVSQHMRGVVSEAELIAKVFEVQMPDRLAIGSNSDDRLSVAASLAQIDVQEGTELFVFDTAGALDTHVIGQAQRPANLSHSQTTVIIDTLTWLWSRRSTTPTRHANSDPRTVAELARRHVDDALEPGTHVATSMIEGRTAVTVATPIMHKGAAVGIIAMVSMTGEIDHLLKVEHERILQIFLIALLVSIGLSLLLASSIAHPLADLAAAAEIGGARHNDRQKSKRIRIPDLTARSDEIGRLSGALRGMVAALYSRIDGNEQFAADVAHEIKNPLASLRSAVGTLRGVAREDQREKLLAVIEHDVRRLDRLVSDISSASRLDSDLVKEQEHPFDLLAMLRNLSQYLGQQAGDKGIEFITDFPEQEAVINGLEARLAQVFVNLVSNAISFCEAGDAIRVWLRRRQNRILIVVEDTGPGIPDQALSRVFQRFYSQRDADEFGNNSGLGLAISRQIVEAHGGVIWAENIRPTDADITSDPLGARFVVGLPV